MKAKCLKFSSFALFASFLFVSYSSCAQNEFGLKGGVLFSGIHKDHSGSVFSFEKRTGYAAGVFLKMNNLFGPVGLQSELLYQLKGGDVFIRHFCEDNSYSSGGYSVGYGYANPATVPWMRNQQKYHYLNLPLLLSFSPLKFLDIYAGPEVGYLISYPKIVIGRNKPNRFSAAVTAGFALKISDYTKLDIRYSEDLTPVNDFGDTDIKNYSFSVGLQRALFRNSE